MWNKHLQEVIDKLNTTLQEMPPKQRARVISLVQRKLTSANSNSKATRKLTNPNQDWMLPPGDLQRSPYIPSVEQRVEQRVAADTEPLPPVIQRITDALPIMAAPIQLPSAHSV